MKTLFVTGAEGFAGSNLIQYLRQRGYEVVVGVRNRARKLTLERNAYKALVCDVGDAINVARTIASVRPDGVIHLAGTPTAAAAENDPLTAYQAIVSGWANILDAVRRTVPRSRILLISSADVYGNTGDANQAIDESAPTRPISTFGAFKATAESIANTYFQQYHLNTTIARPFSYTGAGQPTGFFFASIAEKLAAWNSADGDELKLPDLNCRRDLLHIDDVVSAYERLLVDGKPNTIYNVCSGTGQTCREFVQTLIQQSGQNIRLADAASGNDNRRINNLCGNNGKLRTELGWQPGKTASVALADLYNGAKQAATATPTAKSNGLSRPATPISNNRAQFANAGTN